MKIKIQLFGPLTEICNGYQIENELVADTHTLLEILKEKYPALKTSVFAIAVNNQLRKENTLLQEDDTVSLLPPFSGG